MTGRLTYEHKRSAAVHAREQCARTPLCRSSFYFLNDGYRRDLPSWSN